MRRSFRYDRHVAVGGRKSSHVTPTIRTKYKYETDVRLKVKEEKYRARRIR